MPLSKYELNSTLRFLILLTKIKIAIVFKRGLFLFKATEVMTVKFGHGKPLL